MARINETQSAPPSPSGRSRSRFQPVSTSFDDLDLPQTTLKLEPIFCCSVCSDSSKSDAFQNFTELLSDSPPFQGSVKSIGSNCRHVITVTTTTKKPGPNTIKKPARYFDLNDTVAEYQEIDSILYTYLLDTSDFDDATSKARFTCPVHRQTYQLTRQDRTEAVENSTELLPKEDLEKVVKVGVDTTQPLTEVKGSSRPPLSPRQISMEKRRFLVKKLRYGRKDQIEEIVQDVLSRSGHKQQQRLGLYLNIDSTFEGQDDEDEHKKEVVKKMKELKRIDFEVNYCLGLMRMCFLFGKRLGNV